MWCAIDPLDHPAAHERRTGSRENAMVNGIRNSMFERPSRYWKSYVYHCNPALDEFSAVDQDEVHLDLFSAEVGGPIPC
jgi:hypothetical protein